MPMPLRLCHIIPTLDRSGAEKQLALLACRQHAQGMPVEVVALTRGGPYERRLREVGVPTTVLGKRFKLDPLTLRNLHRHLKAGRPDIVQTWLFAANSYGRLAASWAGVPTLVATERCVDQWKGPVERFVDRRLLARTDAVVANSRAVAGFYRRAGVPEDKLHVIPNAAVLPAPVRDAAEVPGRAERLATLGLEDRFTLLFVGRLWPQKRLRDLIWAVSILELAGYHANLLVVGDGPLGERLRQFAHGLHLDGRVTFLGHRGDVPELLTLADAVAIPSEYEGMPNVALEAMAHARPVVASRIAGMDEVVVHDGTGLLVEPKSPVALSQAVIRLLTEDGLAVRLGRAGRARVKQRFTEDAMVAAYDGLYRRLRP